MSSPARKRRLNQTCTITRPPATGETGVSTVAQDLPCTAPFPASKNTRERPDLATIVSLFEILTAEAAIESDDKLTVNGRSFDILQAQQWQPSRPGQETTYHVIMEEVID